MNWPSQKNGALNQIVNLIQNRPWFRVRLVLLVVCVLLQPVSVSANDTGTNTSNENTNTQTVAAENDNTVCGEPGTPCGGDPPPDGGPTGQLEPSTVVGNPISLVTGNKYQREQDYSVTGSRLAFSRHYNSAQSEHSKGLGQGWSGTFGARIEALASGGFAVMDSTGREFKFDDASDAENGITHFRESSSSTSGYVWQLGNDYLWQMSDGRKLTFRGSVLVRIDFPGHQSLDLYYRNSRLAEVKDEAGRMLQLEYAQNDSGLREFTRGRFKDIPGFLKRLILPDSSIIEYQYDDDFNLARVQYGDGTSTEYHYEDESYPNHLTGITDRLGKRYASWAYNEAGMAILSEHAAGVERVTLEYDMPTGDNDIGTTYLTNSEASVSTYQWQHIKSSGKLLLLSSEGPGCATCPPANMRYHYTPDYKLSSSVDLLGNEKRYFYDDSGRLEKVERVGARQAAATMEVRYEYDGKGLKPARIVRPSVNQQGEYQTAIRYNSDSQPIEVTESGFAPLLPAASAGLSSLYSSISRTTTMTYDAGLISEIDGPREDVADITRFRYDQLGRLLQMALPSGEIIAINKYDEHGRAVEFRHAQHPEVSLEYDNNGNISRVTRLGQSVVYGYNAVNRLVRVTNPNGKISRLSYDDAHRLTKVTDDLGRNVELTLNTESELSDRSFFGINGELIHALNYVFDAEGRIQSVTEETPDYSNGGTRNRTRDVEYDTFGELSGVADSATGVSAKYVFNDLGRLLNVVEPNGLSISNEYDVHDRLISHTDKRLNTTQYHRDDFGHIHFQISHDTGVTQYDFDAAGNRIEKRNANDEVTRYQWDAANRLVEQQDSAGKTTYTYGASNGRLLETSNLHTTETYTYTPLAQLKTHTRHIDEHKFTTEYQYEANGKLRNKILPDGQTLRYHYHESGPMAGGLRAITRETVFGLSQSTLLAEIDLDARDGQSSFLSHNGRRNEYQHTSDGRVNSISVSDTMSLEYQFNEDGDIVGISQDGYHQQYRYRAGQLSRAQTSTGNYSYRYDAAGNRTQSLAKDANANKDHSLNYEPAGKGNRLQSVLDSMTGEQIDYRYNEVGSPIKIGDLRYEYNADQRPIKVLRDGQVLVEYQYNSFGERIKKLSYSKDQKKVTYFLYDNRVLVAEIDADTLEHRQTVYLKHVPVVHLIGKSAYAIHTDHLGTPKQLSNSRGESVWQALHTPLGEAIVTKANISFNLRFPGQYADAETGTHYNYLRDYDPRTGRYLTSDPVGLEGGDNTYAYANNNLLGEMDVLGLSAQLVGLPLSTGASPTATAFSLDNAGNAVENPSTIPPDIADYGITDPNQLADSFITIGSPCDSAAGMGHFNDGIDRVIHGTLYNDGTGRMLTGSEIQAQIDDLRQDSIRQPNRELVARAFDTWDGFDDSSLLVIPYCATDAQVTDIVHNNLGKLVHPTEIANMIAGLGGKNADGCRQAQIVDVTDLHEGVRSRAQVLLATDPRVTDAEKALIIAQAALDDFIKEFPDARCEPGRIESFITAADTELCRLRDVVAEKSENLATALSDVYDELESNDMIPPYDTRAGRAAARRAMMLTIIGVFIPLTATDLAIEAATWGFGKVARLFDGALTFLRSITRVNRAGIDDIVAAGSEAAIRANRIKMQAAYPNYAGLGDMPYRDVVRIENSVGPDKLSKLNDAMSASPELTSAMRANPRLANAWRILDDAAERGSCSFDGSMEVPTLRGQIPIQDIQAGRDYVFAKDELTGLLGYKLVSAVYSNLYNKQVLITSLNDSTGEIQTIISNEIHPVFALPLTPSFMASSEGHDYQGEIRGGQWIDAAHLQSGDKLLNAESSYSTVVSVELLDKRFQAFNLTVADFHTYFIGAPGSDTAFWVHNDCFSHALIKNDPAVLARLTDDVDRTPGLKAVLDEPGMVEQWDKLADFPNARRNPNTLYMAKELQDTIPQPGNAVASSRAGAVLANGTSIRSDQTFRNILPSPNSPANHERFGIITPPGSNGGIRISDPQKYMTELRSHYQSRNIELSDEVARAIEEQISDPYSLFIRDDGLPGFHAEIVAVNDMFIQARNAGTTIRNLDVATVRPRTGEDFVACGNCQSILGRINRPMTIITND